MFNKPTFCLLLWASAAASFAQSSTDIQAKPGSSAYLQGAHAVIARSSSGLCWRTTSWVSAESVAGCDGDLVPPIAKITAPAIVPAPEQPTPTHAVAPAPAVTPIKRCDFTVALDNQIIFGFGKATLSPIAESWLDGAFLTRLKACSKLDLITITGHTDRLGSAQFNQVLSDRRAEAVAEYVKRRGIAAQIDTFGVGQKQPVKDCEGVHDRKKLVECLAPNRRVVIDVRGLSK